MEKARILFIEDDSVDRSPLCEELRQQGHTVSSTRRREEASPLLQQGKFDLAILATPLPDPSVLSFVMALKRCGGRRSLPVVIVGQSVPVSAGQLVQRSGADEVLTDPVAPGDLSLRVDALLERAAGWIELEHEREAANERERVREELTALIVHDLKNPLAAILANLDFCLAEIPRTDQSLVEAIQDSKSAARRMLRLLANMLDISRMETNRLKLKPQRVDVAALFGSVAKLRSNQAQSRSILLDVAVGEALRVQVDEDILTRVVENILDNALRYTPRGGRIRFSGQRHDGLVRLRVANNGPPIPPHAREALFDKYAQGGQSSSMNLGLGMYFCRLAVEAHGGRIWIEEEPDFPTVFVLDLAAGD